MITVKQEDIIQSIADALQFISFYHPPDFIQALYRSYQSEQNPVAKDAIAQMLINSRLCAEGHRPICQDTGIVNAFIQVGMQLSWDQASLTLEEMVNEGVRRGYANPDNKLRASIVADPDGARKNTQDNTPAVTHLTLVPGSHLEIHLAAKGGGSEAKAKFAMLNPSDSVVDWVLSVVPTMGSGWCPPGILGVGIGGTAEKAMLLAKESLLAPVDIQELKERGAQNRAQTLRLELFSKINQLGIGAQGLGGLSTVLDVKVKDFPSHAANKAVAVIPNCAATRHVHFRLDGSGPVRLTPPKLSLWPKIVQDKQSQSRPVNLAHISREEIARWQLGDKLLLSGKVLTARDAAHKRLVDMLARGEPLPVDFAGRFVYYVGPVDPVGDEVVGPAGPTTATRMDPFVEPLLANTGLLGMIGKAERGAEAVASIKKHKACYLIAVGGAAFLISQAIRSAKVVAFEDLGMEAIYEFEVVDMPVTVAVDVQGRSIHEQGPALWRGKIADKLIATTAR